MATDPGTRSPGSLVIFYNDRGAEHSCSVALVAGVDIQLVTDLRADAIQVAGVVAPNLPPNRTITGWGLRLAGGGPSYREAFDEAIPGSSGGTVGATDWYSATVSIMGRSAGTGVGAARGTTRLVLFTGNTYPPVPGAKMLPGILPAALSSLIAVFAASTRYFADYYGQKADFTGHVTVQFNAHAQKKLGN